jgi:hypothetical protein
MRVLFASNKNTADRFLTWASKTLFTAQMGSTDQKHEFIANLVGVSTEAVKSVFNKTAHTIPCIYLFHIGQVKNLRKTFNINENYDDDSYVCKWGMSIDLERRTKEHEKTYGKIKNSKLELLTFGYIDPQYISEAETRIKDIFEAMELKLNNEKYKEIAIIPKNKLKEIKKQYESVSQIYMGHITDLINKLKIKDYEIIMLKKEHEIELLKFLNIMCLLIKLIIENIYSGY